MGLNNECLQTGTGGGQQMQQKIMEAYDSIRLASEKAKAADSGSSSGGSAVYAMTEQEQLRLRMHQVETSVLKIHELCYSMANKVGVAGSELEQHKPQLVS